jgi:hypothetical protein
MRVQLRRRKSAIRVGETVESGADNNSKGWIGCNATPFPLTAFLDLCAPPLVALSVRTKGDSEETIVGVPAAKVAVVVMVVVVMSLV